MPLNNALPLYPICVLLLCILTGCGLIGDDCPKIDANGTNQPCVASLKDVEAVDTPEYPNYLEPIENQTSKVETVRVTDNNKKDAVQLRHHYSRRQAWNSDETLIDLGQRIIKSDDYSEALDYDPLSSERNWLNNDPNKIIGIRYNPDPNELVIFDLSDEKYTSLIWLVEYKKCKIGNGEGNITRDDKFIALICSTTKAKDSDHFIITIDIDNRKVIAKLKAEPNINWASFTESGAYVLVENNEHPDPNPELIRYTPTLENPTLLHANPSHGDLTIDSDGHDLYVMIRSSDVTAIRIADRLQTTMPIGKNSLIGQGHISCRQTQQPDWCYISSYGQGHIGAVKIKLKSRKLGTEDQAIKTVRGPRAYVHWGYHHSGQESYASQAKATVSRSGDKILFTSDWGSDGITDDFLLIRQ